MSFTSGIYEQLVTKLIANKLENLADEHFLIEKVKLDKVEASRYLSLHLLNSIEYALNSYSGEHSLPKQIELFNKIIQTLLKELPNLSFSEDLIENEGELLNAVFARENFPYPYLNERIKQIMPYTRLSQSELFTGNNVGISLESEIKKEILSSDEICWLVSFIKYSGIRIFKEELEEFTNSGKKLRIITTSYMGATDVKAIEFLASLKNTEIKVSYNSEHERLHAKAYLFLRNTGFDTGYIGSSNLSRSALTNGLEWNLKVTTKEISHIIDKFKKTFYTYWEDKEFEFYEFGKDKVKLSEALRSQKTGDTKSIITFFDLKPFPYQEEILEKLDAERLIHNRFKNLLVAATGTGKTVISAFDYKRYKLNNPRARLLFVAHRKEILDQAQETFKHVLRDNNFGEFWGYGIEPSSYDYLFASVTTLSNRIKDLDLVDDFYDFIIFDEVHHISASSYRPILERFKPKIILGLTATPERMDGEDILKDFCNTIAAEIRLPEAVNRKLLSPFQYFGISDSIDLSKINWKNGKYEINELTKLYTEDDRRVGEILAGCEKYLTDINEVRALGFCVSQDHAKYMAEKFVLAGLKADFLVSSHEKNRDNVRNSLRKKEINYLFVCDIFNEGVDIPEIDTVLFLRPTESLTVFLQQLGRGLRLATNKDCLTVLDFVGNARPEYDFEHKFRALVGKTQTSIQKEIEDEFPHLPLGCSIVLEKKAKEVILNNVKKAIGFNRNQLVTKIRNFKHQSLLPLTLYNFLEFYHLEPPLIFKKGSWSRLCVDAGVISDFHEPQESELTNCISRRLLQCNSASYFRFLLNFLQYQLNIRDLRNAELQYLLMFHYDAWQKDGQKFGFENLIESMNQLKQNPIMLSEIKEVLEILINQIDFVEKKIDLGFEFPLKVHSRYNRDEVLVALQLNKFETASSNREGVALNKELNIEALFITLKKSEKEYSPTTLYDDYAISNNLFHWQSQNATSPESPKGQSYINHQKSGKKILMFVREQNENQYGFKMGYVFLGLVNFIESTGAKPMNIKWKLEQSMPSYIWKESGKLSVG